jgi:Tol biopolymer transport system component
MRKRCLALSILGIATALFWLAQPVTSSFGVMNFGDSIQAPDKLADQHFKKAIDLLKQTQYQDAIAEYERVISLLPESEVALDARYWIGQSYFQMGKHEEALSIFKKLIQEYPGSAIAPVTQLMIARVEKDKEISKVRAKRDAAADKKVIIDPKTGARFKRIAVLTGNKDIAQGLNQNMLSPNGKFLLVGRIVIPIEEGEPFNFLEGKPMLRGTWSPDGKKVVYYSENAIWIVPVSAETGRPTGPSKKLLDGKYRYQHPVSWSPDSTKIAFPRMDDDTAGDIWILSIKDGSLSQLTDDPGYESNACWSPDGKILAYNTRGMVQEIRLVSAEGGESKKIIGMEYGRLYSWSPDGQWLVYDTRQNLCLYRFADKTTVDIDFPDEVGHFFCWSNDGKKMLFDRSSYEWRSNLRVVSASGGPSFQLSRNLELWPHSQFWTSESDTIVTSRAGDSIYVIIPLLGGEPIPINLGLAAEENITPISLSPDRKKLLYSIELENGKEDLYTVPLSLQEARTKGSPVLVFGNWDRRITRTQSSWSPDSKNIALIHKGDVWITSSEEEKPVQLTKTSAVEYGPVWSPGGEIIAYTSEINEGDVRLMVVSASGGEPRELFINPVTKCWSPDGKGLTVISGKKILDIPISGGESKEILDLGDKGFTNRLWGLTWFPDGKRVAFVEDKEKGENRTHIYVASIETGDVLEIASNDPSWKDYIFLSPDGKWISYCTDEFVKVRPQSTIWEVEVEDLIK